MLYKLTLNCTIRPAFGRTALFLLTSLAFSVDEQEGESGTVRLGKAHPLRCQVIPPYKKKKKEKKTLCLKAISVYDGHWDARERQCGIMWTDSSFVIHWVRNSLYIRVFIVPNPGKIFTSSRSCDKREALIGTHAVLGQFWEEKVSVVCNLLKFEAQETVRKLRRSSFSPPNHPNLR